MSHWADVEPDFKSSRFRVDFYLTMHSLGTNMCHEQHVQRPLKIMNQ